MFHSVDWLNLNIFREIKRMKSLIFILRLPTVLNAALDRPVGQKLFSTYCEITYHKIYILELSGIDGINQWTQITNDLESLRTSFIYNIDPYGQYGCNRVNIFDI